MENGITNDESKAIDNFVEGVSKLNIPDVMPRFIYQKREVVILVKMGKIWAEVKDTIGNTMYVLNRYLVPENGA